MRVPTMPTTILPGNLILLIMLTTLSLDVYRTFFAPNAPARRPKPEKS
jgi:hypothetical protein